MNHGISSELVERLKKLTHQYHDAALKPAFEESELAKKLENGDSRIGDKDWETCFFVQHLPTNNAAKVPNISLELM